MQAHGEFDVILNAQPDEAPFAMGRMTLDKAFRGDLAGTSRGQMLSVRTGAGDSGAYVAIEVVTAVLGGREGTFALQHNSTMTRGTPHQNISVVPGSGTGALEGLSGTMTIDVRDGRHFYDFNYSLEDSQ